MSRQAGLFVEIIACVLLGLCVRTWAATPVERPAPVERRVLAFYYPWYGIPDGPGGAGKVVHWGKIDARGHDIAASTHYPLLGAYDSHDPKVIEQHCQWATDAHVDTFIVSWWGHGDYTDRAMPKILDICASHGMSACIYYETVPQPQTAETAAQDIIRVLQKYGSHKAHLKVGGKPVVFIYGRAVGQLGLTGWLAAVKLINAGFPGGAVLIGDEFSYGAARVFDGIHTYNTAGSVAGKSLADLQKWAAGTYPSWVQLADGADKISTITVIPGYDDTKIRKPGLAVDRLDGELYRVQWEQAIAVDPHWVLVTTFNEWHEGSEIEPSLEFGRKYLDLTGPFAERFKSTPRQAHASTLPGALTPAEKEQLRQRLQKLPIAVLPEPESMAFWWLLDIGITPKLLTWDEIVTTGIKPQDYPILLYAAGEKYRRTVRTTGDVDEALVRYEQAGGCLATLPSLPWPFYYDETGKAVNQSARFGLTLKMGWEHPPAGTILQFVQPARLLPHVPDRFDFPTGGDLRWRPFYQQSQVEYTPVLQLRDGTGGPLGDAAVCAKLPTGGYVAYAWFGLLNTAQAEPLLYDLFTFLAGRLGQ
jgi:glycoprotein endo-alpha-1,2-mannosidase